MESILVEIHSLEFWFQVERTRDQKNNIKVERSQWL